jgi:hypothetical protein
MKSCIGFVGLLAFGKCNNNHHHISRTTRTDPTKAFHCKSYPYLHPAISIRGGGGKCISSTKLNLSIGATMASLIAGSVGGAIGVGVSYPFDTLSTKAQVSSGKKQVNFVQNIRTIWINEGIRGFFEGVIVSVRDIHTQWRRHTRALLSSLELMIVPYLCT